MKRETFCAPKSFTGEQYTVEYPIRDRRGKDFSIRIERTPTHWSFQIQTGTGATIGCLRLGVAAHVCEIEEFEVKEKCVTPISPWLQTLLDGLRLPLPSMKCRGRGLGSLLLIYGLKVAHDSGLGEVRGRIPAERVAVRMFRNSGFSLRECAGGYTVCRSIQH